MKTVWAVMRTEMRLTWRRYTFWVVQGIWLLPLALTFVSNLPNAQTLAGASFVSEQITTDLTMWLVLLPLIVGPALTRDLGEVGEIIWGTPLDALMHLFGVALGLLLALLPALLVRLALQWLVGYALVGGSAILFWYYGPPLFLTSTVASMSVAMVLALLLRRTLLLLLVWMALWALVMQASLGFFGIFEAVALASLANVFFYNLQLSPSLGLGLARPLVQGLVVWFMGVGVLGTLLGAGVALLTDQRRRMRPGGLLVTWVVVAGLLAGGGGLLHARAVRALAVPASSTASTPEQWEVQAHTLEVFVDAEQDTLRGASTLRLAPFQTLQEAEVVLRLNHGLRVTAVGDEAGQPLRWEQSGARVRVALPAPTTAPLTLQLQWQGTPHLSYADFVEGHGARLHRFATVYPVPTLLSEGVGYLFRDGDWYPWPWRAGSDAHQAAMSRVSVHVTGAVPLASAPLREGVVAWEGELPAVLVVLPPARHSVMDGRTLSYGSWMSPQTVLLTRLRQMAGLLPSFASLVGAQPVPSHIVALPYLPDLVWSGDLLLVPEGTGPLSDNLRRLLLSPSLAGETGGAMEARAVVTSLARAWLASHLVLPARDTSPGLPPSIPGAAPFTQGESGQDLRTQVKAHLNPEDHLDLLALWLAVESAEPSVREGDLAVLLAPPDPSPSSAKFEPFLLRSLPFDFPVGQGPKGALLHAWHHWLEQVGREQAFLVVGQAVRDQAGEFDLAGLMTALAQRSGVPIQDEGRE